MPSFLFFNVQATPVDNQKEIGVSGYCQVTNQLKNNTSIAYQGKNINTIAFPLRNDMFFAPDVIHLSDDKKYAYGKFIKFDQASSLMNLYTKEVEFAGGNGTSAHQYYFDFVYDFESHILAISNEKQKLPSINELEKALCHLFSPVFSMHFDKHVCDVICLKSGSDLQKVFREAKFYQRAHVTLTISNSMKFKNAMEDEMRAKSIAKIDHVESSSPKGLMSDLTNSCKDYLTLATSLGHATITYWTGASDDLRKITYHMNDYPVKSSISSHKLDSAKENKWEMIKNLIKSALDSANPKKGKDDEDLN